MRRRHRPDRNLVRALGLAALLLAAAAGRAAAGDPATGVLDFAGKQVPLPRGAWELMATGEQPAGAAEAPYGVVRSAILLQRDGEQVRALLEVNANDIAVSGGWAAPCGNDPLPPQLRLRYRSQYDASCAGAGATRPDAAGPPVWQEARAGIERDGLHLPGTMLTATALCADRQDFLEVRIHVLDVPGTDDAARQKALLDWATLYAALLEEGLSRRVGGLVLDWPGRAALLQDPPVTGPAAAAHRGDAPQRRHHPGRGGGAGTGRGAAIAAQRRGPAPARFAGHQDQRAADQPGHRLQRDPGRAAVGGHRGERISRLQLAGGGQ